MASTAELYGMPRKVRNKWWAYTKRLKAGNKRYAMMVARMIEETGTGKKPENTGKAARKRR